MGSGVSNGCGKGLGRGEAAWEQVGDEGEQAGTQGWADTGWRKLSERRRVSFGEWLDEAISFQTFRNKCVGLRRGGG